MESYDSCKKINNIFHLCFLHSETCYDLDECEVHFSLMELLKVKKDNLPDFASYVLTIMLILDRYTLGEQTTTTSWDTVIRGFHQHE